MPLAPASRQASTRPAADIPRAGGTPEARTSAGPAQGPRTRPAPRTRTPNPAPAHSRTGTGQTSQASARQALDPTRPQAIPTDSVTLSDRRGPGERTLTRRSARQLGRLDDCLDCVPNWAICTRRMLGRRVWRIRRFCWPAALPWDLSTTAVRRLPRCCGATVVLVAEWSRRT